MKRKSKWPRRVRVGKSTPRYALLEAVADIAYAAGVVRYYGGDSRQDIADYIRWAQEFEDKHKGNDWESGDYIETIDAFARQKMGVV